MIPLRKILLALLCTAKITVPSIAVSYVLMQPSVALADQNIDHHASSDQAGSDRPNVIVIFTDDHRYSGVHVNGCDPIQTPNMDALAKRGVRFTNAYLSGAFTGATCIPSRAQLLTGRSVFQLDSMGRRLPSEHTTIGEAFAASGYRTHIVGKWHQDIPSLHRCFQSGDRLMGGGFGSYLTDHFRMPMWDFDASQEYGFGKGYLLQSIDGKVTRRPLAKTDQRGPIADESFGPHTSETFADAACQFIAKQDPSQPYLMYVAFHAPHEPRQAPQQFRDLYPVDEVTLTPSYASQHPFDNGHLYLRDEKLAAWPRTPEVARQQLADYYAIITHLDAQIGKILDSLQESNQLGNTVIALAGDSGLAVGNHGLMGKQNVYDEDGIHVPMIVAGAGIDSPGQTRDALCYTYDLFPTLCERCGIDVPNSVTGHSLTNVLRDSDATVRDYLYHAYMPYQRAYRKGDYKLIEYVRAPDFTAKTNRAKRSRNATEEPASKVPLRGSRVTQLFNVAEDPWETLNLAMFPEHGQRLESMRQAMKAAAKPEGDTATGAGVSVDFWDYYTD